MASPRSLTRILILGATQGVGQALLEHFSQPHWASRVEVYALSRHPMPVTQRNIHWQVYDLDDGPINQPTDVLISLGPIQYAVQYLKSQPNHIAPQAVWVLSSASTDFKYNSSNAPERNLMASILGHEQMLLRHCHQHRINHQLFKTTLLYGREDKNINRLSELIARLRWVPVVGDGLRAPVHVDDVAELIIQQLHQWLEDGGLAAGVWRLQGGEMLSYPQMLQSIAAARGLKLSVLPLPLGLLQWGLSLVHTLGGLQDIKASMLERQRQDLVVDDQPARDRLNWRPRRFLGAEKG